MALRPALPFVPLLALLTSCAIGPTATGPSGPDPGPAEATRSTAAAEPSAASVTPTPSTRAADTPTETATMPRESANRLLLKSAADGDVAGARRALAAGADLEIRNERRQTPLVVAAYGNHLEVARLLLQSGADPNAKDETVQSAYLISTSEVGDDPRLLRLTLQHGADVASLDSYRGTGLIRAADRGFHRIIEVLLETDLEIDHVNRLGYTALHEAVVLGDGGESHVRTVAALVRGGVDTSIEDSSGRTALQSARDRGYRRIAALLD